MYNIGIRGWERLIGVQLMKITTIGRRTGKLHSVLVDVVDHDSEKDVYYISSAYGAGADWVKNIRANPVFDVQVGRRRFKAESEQVSGEIGSKLLFRYIDEHRDYVKGLYKMMGIDLDVLSEEELMEVLEKEMVLAIKPSMKQEK
jgi:deazaflavin-dependent oxidoreductase (nitroreductase family)